jgi:hypothetical protein
VHKHRRAVWRIFVDFIFSAASGMERPQQSPINVGAPVFVLLCAVCSRILVNV